MQKLVFYWLCIVAAMILCMVSIGGVTRLTNSGLSIVEWKPITGVIPPLSEQDWQLEFSKYQQSPEFVIKNNSMELEAFKQIFWLEYIHRLAGRIVGLVFFIPLLIFWAKGWFDKTTKKTIGQVAILGICQGFMGWHMVKSGLSGAPYVSHFRLTAHLLFALSMFGLIINDATRLYNEGITAKIDKIWIACISLAVIQIALGGLVAGLDAGLIYPTFPLMGDSFFPQELFEKALNEFLSNPGVVQFLHRICAYILAGLVFYLSMKLLDKGHHNISKALALVIFIQFLLGIGTLLMHVPVSLAALHQLFGFVLFGIIIVASRVSIKSRAIQRHSKISA